MKIESPAFGNNDRIPKKYTCDGEDISPPLHFSDIPPEAKTLAIVVDDPDAPMGVFDHWIAWNIPANTDKLEEGAQMEIEGTNDFHEIGYRGPCPPPGKPHEYRFKVYALDTELDLPEGISKHQLEQAMEGHILSKGQLIGSYSR